MKLHAVIQSNSSNNEQMLLYIVFLLHQNLRLQVLRAAEYFS